MTVKSAVGALRREAMEFDYDVYTKAYHKAVNEWGYSVTEAEEYAARMEREAAQKASQAEAND